MNYARDKSFFLPMALLGTFCRFLGLSSFVTKELSLYVLFLEGQVLMSALVLSFSYLAAFYFFDRAFRIKAWTS
jgi:hypothetical protein